ncbi:MAG: WD40 repeat domain-containing protein, partial [Candidatus Xenobia bacterium]
RHPGAHRLLTVGEHLLVGTLSGKLLLYQGNRLRATVRAHTGAITGMAARGDHVYTTSADGTLRRWKMRGTPEEQTVDHGAPLLGLAVSGTGEVVTLGADRSIVAYDATLQPYRMLEHLQFSAALSSDGSELATAGPDGVSFWKFPPPR